VLTIRPTWTRRLTLLHSPSSDTLPTAADDSDDSLRVHSWFRSVANARRFALYSVRQTESPMAPLACDDHTLVVVREFRRVPLVASALAMTLFTARPGYAATLVAALAHFSERAVSVYQPAYLLLARSLEQPCLTTLVTGVHEGTALLAARATAFSFEPMLPEIGPMLATAPEGFAYHRELVSGLDSLVSPHAV
jgi:hypothetical protein